VPTAGERAGWIDLTKGFAILFVVMHHAGTYDRAIFSLGSNGVDHFWVGAELLLYHMRLPLFFFVSGMLASGHYSRRSTGPTLDSARRVGRTYVVWAIILSFLAPDWPLDHVRLMPDWHRLPAILWGGSVAWYLWAMLLSFGFAWGTRRLPSAVAVGLAVLVGAVLPELIAEAGSAFRSFARCLPLYVLGMRFPGVGSWIAGQCGVRRISAVVLAYLIAASLSGAWSIPMVLMDIFGIVVGLALVGATSRHAMGQLGWIAWMGRRTLPVYLIHFPVIAVLGCAAIRLLPQLPPQHPMSFLFVPVISILAIGASIAVHRIIVSVGGGWLFAPPSPLDVLLRRRRSQPIRPTDQLPMDGEAA